MNISALIVGQRGRLRDGLRAILLAHAKIDEVNTAASFAAALQLITPFYPSLIVIDGSDIIGHECRFLKQYLFLQGQKPCIVIADSLEQQVNAQNAGADAVLMQGFSTRELYAVLDRLIVLIEGRNHSLAKGANPISAKNDQLSQMKSLF